jgi:hypothetical protein
LRNELEQLRRVAHHIHAPLIRVDLLANWRESLD